jgi:hypothetical protein
VGFGRAFGGEQATAENPVRQQSVINAEAAVKDTKIQQYYAFILRNVPSN